LPEAERIALRLGINLGDVSGDGFAPSPYTFAGNVNASRIGDPLY
jgi:hypothetical protein